jgi:hypothetical protein
MALRCLLLTGLTMTLDVLRLPPALTVPILSHCLKEINLRTSPINNPETFVQLLDRIFLCVHSIFSFDDETWDISKLDLGNLYKRCRGARTHVRI